MEEKLKKEAEKWLLNVLKIAKKLQEDPAEKRKYLRWKKAWDKAHKKNKREEEGEKP